MQCSCDAMREYEQVAPHQVVYRPISILSGTSDISGATFFTLSQRHRRLLA